jgi:hypothetical protein
VSTREPDLFKGLFAAPADRTGKNRGLESSAMFIDRKSLVCEANAFA